MGVEIEARETLTVWGADAASILLAAASASAVAPLAGNGGRQQEGVVSEEGRIKADVGRRTLRPSSLRCRCFVICSHIAEGLQRQPGEAN